MVALLTLGAECSLFTSKPAHFSRLLPPEASISGKLGQTSTDFKVKHRKSARIMGISDLSSGDAALGAASPEDKL
jgi:hypothetical protein